MQEYVTGRHSVSKKNGFRRFQAHRFVPSSAIGVVVKTGKPVFLMRGLNLIGSFTKFGGMKSWNDLLYFFIRHALA